MNRRSGASDASLLSYLDVLCCGFGGAVFLFLVFAAAAGAAGTPRVTSPSTPGDAGAVHALVVRWSVAEPEAMVRVQLGAGVGPESGTLTGHCLLDDPSRRCDDLLRPRSDGVVQLPDAFEGITMWLWSSRGEEHLDVTLMVASASLGQLEAMRIYLRCNECPAGGTEVSEWVGWSGESGARDRTETLRTLGRIHTWPSVTRARP